MREECWGSSIYHFAGTPVRVLWNNRRRIEPSIREFDEHHRQKFITWFLGFSPGLESNFGIFEGNLTRIADHKG